MRWPARAIAAIARARQVRAPKRRTRRATRLLSVVAMTRMLRIFHPAIATAIKVAIVSALVSAYILTFAWGYESRQEARRWRDVACRYRVSELERVTPGLAGGSGACEALERIGMSPIRTSAMSTRWSATLAARQMPSPGGFSR
jgi:hypothetical protein